MGIWLIDPEGQPIATDFVSFWAAGKLVLQGHPTEAYDWAAHKAAAVENGLDFKGHFTFQYPPSFLAVTPALALIPYPAALVAWMAVGLLLYLSAIRLDHRHVDCYVRRARLARRVLEHCGRPERFPDRSAAWQPASP